MKWTSPQPPAAISTRATIQPPRTSRWPGPCCDRGDCGKLCTGLSAIGGPGGAKTQARTMLVGTCNSVVTDRRPLAIVPQIWETMIRMSRTDCRVFQTICGIVLFLAGCCRGSTTHKCDFTPPDVPGIDAANDGPLPCGQDICEGGEVCCLKKAPPLAICIPPTEFVKQGCEKMDLPCFMS